MKNEPRQGSGAPDRAPFRHLRNYLAGRLLGASRDSALLQEMVKCLFAHVWLIRQKGKPYSRSIDPLELARAYRGAFAEMRQSLPDLFESNDEILVDPASLSVIADALALINFDSPTHDPVGDLYETFAGNSIQVKEGQFFTPQNAVNWIVEAINPRPGERVIDPACGAGGFLSFTARHLIRLGASHEQVSSSLVGIDKDELLSHLAKTHLSLTTFRSSSVVCADSIAWKSQKSPGLSKEWLGTFDVVMTNPPFGARIDSADETVRRSFSLAHKWRRPKSGGKWAITGELQNNAPPQVLFLERCLTLLKPGGRLGIVVPESLLSSASYAYVVEYLKSHAEIRAVVGMPESLFKTSGKGGTHTKTCLMIAQSRRISPKSPGARSIFMAEAKWCGHDSRGRVIPKDDLPPILANFSSGTKKSAGHLGYWLNESDIANNNLAPRYYDPESARELERLGKTHTLVTIESLVADRIISISTGDEVGKLSYGGGDIPFVRTSDISNWEIKLDPKHGLSEHVYRQYKERQDVRAGDILMVKDGTYLIGHCAFISVYDTRIVYQSHLYKIRVLDTDKLSPYLLLAMLTSEPVLAQIKAKRVTQDIIDSLGDRILELKLPVPRSASLRKHVHDMVLSCISDRIEARELARAATKAVVAIADTPNFKEGPIFSVVEDVLPDGNYRSKRGPQARKSRTAGGGRSGRVSQRSRDSSVPVRKKANRRISK